MSRTGRVKIARVTPEQGDWRLPGIQRSLMNPEAEDPLSVHEMHPVSIERRQLPHSRSNWGSCIIMNSICYHTKYFYEIIWKLTTFRIYYWWSLHWTYWRSSHPISWQVCVSLLDYSIIWIPSQSFNDTIHWTQRIKINARISNEGLKNDIAHNFKYLPLVIGKEFWKVFEILFLKFLLHFVVYGFSFSVPCNMSLTEWL